MKKIEAIIRATKFENVRNALAKINVKFFTLIEVKGYGLQKGERIFYRGSSYDTDFISRLRLDILTTDQRAEEIVQVISRAARTGEVGDGKITIIDVENVVRIRNWDQGPDAL